MNKAELIDRLAQRANVTKKQAEDLLDGFEHEVIAALKGGGEVTLTGFGTFQARQRSARAGVNPRNPSERIQMPAVTVPKFTAGKRLKDALKRVENAERETGSTEQEAGAQENSKQ